MVKDIMDLGDNYLNQLVSEIDECIKDTHFKKMLAEQKQFEESNK